MMGPWLKAKHFHQTSSRSGVVKSKDRDASIDQIQAEQYSFPYHYIPNVNGYPKFSRRSAYAPSYLAAIQISTDWLLRHCLNNLNGDLHKHIDIGCGDGGFIHALTQCEIPESVEFTGIDMDQRAIAWATMFNPSIRFTTESVSEVESDAWDSGSVVEVIEHIPPAELPTFVSNVGRVIRPNGSLFVTVPSTEIAISAKHYQHFTFESLKSVFGDMFEVVECFGFERKNWLTRTYFRHFFKRRFHLEIGKMSRYIIRTYAAKHARLRGCGRIGLMLKVR